jgi:hypothetical protein
LKPLAELRALAEGVVDGSRTTLEYEETFTPDVVLALITEGQLAEERLIELRSPAPAHDVGIADGIQAKYAARAAEMVFRRDDTDHAFGSTGRFLSTNDIEGMRSGIAAAMEEAYADGQRDQYRGDLSAAVAEGEARGLERAAKLREAADEAMAEMKLCTTRDFDAPEDAEVGALGRRIGFGALMDAASKEWKRSLEATGWPSGGQHTTGPCFDTVDRTRKMLAAAMADYDSALRTTAGASARSYEDGLATAAAFAEEVCGKADGIGDEIRALKAVPR